MGLEKDKLFVYGTLLRGFPLHKYLRKGGVRYLGKAKIHGRLYDLGQFPGALPSESPAEEIEGELYELSDPTEQLKELDEVEEFYPNRLRKSLFVRELAHVRLPTGQSVRAWVYFLSRKPPNARFIESGDYAEARRPGTSAK
jgi:gamma-glutamylcyclotransferase (GGCT)/AIG2-like uncharacterized protein YtfP